MGRVDHLFTDKLDSTLTDLYIQSFKCICIFLRCFIENKDRDTV